MIQHRPMVSDDNYQRVMAHLMGRFGESETFDNALWLLLADCEKLKSNRRMLTKELREMSDLLVDEKRRSRNADDLLISEKRIWINAVNLLIAERKRTRKMQSLAIGGYIGIIGLLAYIGFCL